MMQVDCMKYTPAELVQMGFCDPIRLFVKQEPHTLKKCKEGRFRLISSVSLVDQIVERLLFGPQNQLEITMWRSIPSKPGMGLSQYEQAQSIWNDLKYKHLGCPAAEADISGFDWSVQSWELWADCSMRALLGNFTPEVKHLAMSRFYCLMNSVFQLSNGTLIEQGKPGLMKSGSYCTSSTNSRIRCLMAELIGSPWCIAMGDDSVEGFVPDAKRKYEELGHCCKDYVACATTAEGALESVNFCSHRIAEKQFYLTSWPKTLYRYLTGQVGSLEDLQAELWSHPMWSKIQAYCVALESRRNKTNEQTCEEEVECDSSGPDRGGANYPSGSCGECPDSETSPPLQYYGESYGGPCYFPTGDGSSGSWSNYWFSQSTF